MTLKLCVTGMDQTTANRLRDVLDQANAAQGMQWRFTADESEATHVIVDMDSVYGPMSWIRLHGAGKQVVGMTSAARTNADFHLVRDFDVQSVQTLLRRMSGHTDEAYTSQPAVPAEHRGEPSGMTPAPAPMDQLPEETLELPSDEQAAAAPYARQSGTVPTPDPMLSDWFRPGVLGGRFGYKHGDTPMLLIDANQGVYYGPPNLKPLTAHMSQAVRANELRALEGKAWHDAIAAAGSARPLTRLVWFAGLLAGKGHLLPGNNPSGQYLLTKWTQTEREFPKHFRIATVMMKGPATVAEIAKAAQVPPNDVADFINANLAVGHAEAVRFPSPPDNDAHKASGLFGRLRGR